MLAVTVKNADFSPVKSIRVSTSNCALSGAFTVSDGKAVLTEASTVVNTVTLNCATAVTTATWHLEESQTAYPSSWSTSHVGHLFWTKTAAASYAASYSDGTCATSDVPFFAESKGCLTVDGQSGLYALSKDEWSYLIKSRTSGLYKYGVTVTNGGTSYTNCLIIAPDDYSGTALSEITDWSLSNINSLGLVCLPAAGNRSGSNLKNAASSGSGFFNGEGGIYGVRAVDLSFRREKQG